MCVCVRVCAINKLLINKLLYDFKIMFGRYRSIECSWTTIGLSSPGNLKIQYILWLEFIPWSYLLPTFYSNLRRVFINVM